MPFGTYDWFKMSKRIWIVGASSGIGLELVKLWLQKGNQLIVSSQQAKQNETLLHLQEKYPNHLALINLNVIVETKSLKSTVEKAFNHYDGLDIWFYNVGTYHVMSVEHLNIDHFIEMNHSNYLGAVKLMTLLMPYFLQQGSGKWIWNLSLSTYFGLPQGGGYSAPKTALLNLAQSIQPELIQKNIQLQVINHGFVKTRLTAKNSFEMPQLMQKEEATKNIFHAINKPYQFEIRFPLALSLTLRLLSLLPYKWSLYLTRKTLP